ncbi:MAG TPA: hypothetical protein VEI49_02060 [Terriglobales bacterium]|nr:hypothetical protein [Terriglobales bacterium]
MHQSSINQLLERRVHLLQQLANALQRAQDALLIPNYSQIPLHTKAQHDLCQELRRLADEFQSAQVASRGKPADANGASTIPVTACQKALASDLQRLQAQVADLNRKYAAILR